MVDVRASLLRKVLVNIAEQHGYEDPEFQITPVPPTGSNFTSQLFHSVISAPGREDLKLFAKVAVVGEKFRSQMPTRIFDIERHFYTKLAKIYADIEVKHNVPEEHQLVTPKFYGFNDTFAEEIIVLQDIAEEGFTTYDRLKSIDWEYASKAVEELAKLHALSIAYQKEYPEDYEEATTVLKRERMADDPETMGTMQQITGQMLQLAPEEYRDKILEVMADTFKPESFAKFTSPLRRTVIIHSDFRQSNLMHKVHKDGSVQVVIVDYQTMHPGCAANDLIYFIFSGSDGQFRREHYEQLIDHYYQHMAAALRRLDLEPEEVFPREDFDQDLKDVLPFGLVLACVMLPMMTADAAELQAEETESLQSMMGNINANELCAKRFNEVIEDYVAWGIL